ncbi:MAG TPA: DUF1573 domain-containing protein [Bacteroidia bacterium]|nr:DUF1573 domain-containing protein [Bacteroidia bacterium]
MPRFILSAIIMISLLSCSEKGTQKIDASDVSNSESAEGKLSDGAEIQFDEEEFDFGKIIQGEKVSHSFFFTNTGKKNLVISSASGSCGCTVPEWPKEPVLPGKKGKVDVVFNSEGKSGYQEKTITIVTNCEPSTRIIRIKTEIIVAETAR